VTDRSFAVPCQSHYPERVSTATAKGLPGALLRYRVMAYVTGVLLAAMTLIAIPYKLIYGGDPIWYGIGWMMHGWAYIVYVAAALDLVFRLRWGLLQALGVVLAGTVPFMSFVAERKVTHAVTARMGTDDEVATPAKAAAPNG